MTFDKMMPNLPAEIYAIIVSSFRSEQDLVFLWTVLRNVSHMMRDLVDEFIRKRHLPDTHLIPNLTANYSIPFEIISPFLRTSSEDPDIAIFDIAPRMPAVDRISLLRGLAAPHNDWTRPKTFIAVRRLANDTELPNCRWDHQTCEVAVNWRDMFGALLWEEKLRMNLSAKWLERTKAKKAEVLANSTSSNVNNAFMKMVLASKGARDESASQARQKRIQRQVQRTEPGRVWVPGREHVEAFELVEMIQQTTNGWDFED